MKTNGIKQWTMTLGLITVMTIGIHQSKADLLFYDGFNYATGDLPGQDGGSGFNAAWVNAKNNPTVTSTGLSFGNLTVNGGTVINSNGQATRTLSTPVTTTSDIVTNGGSIYLSFLVNETTSTPNYDNLTLFNGTTEFLSIGSVYYNANPSSFYGFRSSGTGLTGTGYVFSEAPVTDDGTHLLVMKLDYSIPNQTQLSLYIDPSAELLGTPVTQTVGGILIFDKIRIEMAGGSSIDELRMGATLSDVLPGIIPEPATLVLLVAGLGLLIGLRRCRRGAMS
jgi:hypothetical protein